MSDVDLRRIAVLLRHAQRRKHSACDAALAAIGANLAQWGVLRVVAENPGSSAHDIAVGTLQTDQSLGQIVTRMISRGLIRRTPGPGRVGHHWLTPSGEDMVRQCDTIVTKVMAEQLDAFTDRELRTLEDLLGKLAGQ